MRGVFSVLRAVLARFPGCVATSMLFPVRDAVRHALHDFRDDVREIALNADFIHQQGVNEALVMINIARYHMQHVVHAAARRVALNNFGRREHTVLEATHVVRGVFCQGYFHDNPARVDGAHPIEFRAITLDDTAFLQLAHAFPRWRDRQVHFLGQPRFRDAAVACEDAKNSDVVAVELHHDQMTTGIWPSITSATTATVSPICTSPGKWRAASKPLRRATYSTAGAPVRVAS